MTTNKWTFVQSSHSEARVLSLIPCTKNNVISININIYFDRFGSQNEKWGFFFVNKLAISGSVATYLGFSNYMDYTDLIITGVHVTPEFRQKYGKYVNWENVPKEYIPKHYQPQVNIKTQEEHGNVLKNLGFTDLNEIRKVISIFEESGLADPLNFPLMAEDLSNLPPAYVQASEYDTLRDDALLYAGRLEESGNKVVLDYQKHGWHGIAHFAETPVVATSALNVFRNVSKFVRKIMSNIGQ